MVAAADVRSRGGHSGYPLFWLGILLILLPTVAAVCSFRPSARERFIVAMGFGLALFLARVVYAPTYFAWGDEFAHYRTTLNFAQSGRLFGDNPIIEPASHYPGIALLTGILSTVSGLSIFVCALIVLAVARIVLTAAIFVAVERISGSAVAAGLGVIIYAGNPNFLYWSAQFAYESLALPLVIAAILLVVDLGDRPKSIRRRISALLVIATVVVTHHLSSYFLAGVLGLLVLITVAARHLGKRKEYVPLAPAALAVGGAALWSGLVASGTAAYLGPVLSRAAGQAWQLVLTRRSSRVPFANGTGAPVAPEWEHLVSYAAVLVSLALVIPALWRIRRRHWPLAGVLIAWTAALWIVLLPLRLTQYGQETANRSTEFAFFGLALAVASLLTGRLVKSRILGRSAVALALVIIFVGGVAISFNFNLRLSPRVASHSSPLIPTSDDRAAAVWFLSEYGPGQRVATDLVTRDTFASEGLQHTLSGVNDRAQLWRVFYARSMTGNVYKEIRRSRIQFIVLQDRLVGTRPWGGPVFDSGDPPASSGRPVPKAAFEKFRGVSGFTLVYRSAEIGIYRVAPSLWDGK